VLRVLVGVTPHQGARESRAQGEVAQVVGCPGAVRYARCETPKQDWALFERCSKEATGELLEIERLTSSLERGHWKSTREGNSPVAYSTARPVVRPAKAGVFSRRETYQGKNQSPVARRAGGRETNLLKPLDSLICGMGASLQAVAQANAQVAPKVRSPGGRACNREGEGSMGRRRLADAADHSGGVGATAWGQGHAKQLEKPSASRCEIGGSKGGCITGPPGNQPKTRGGRMGP